MKDIYIADLANFDEGKLFDSFFLVLAKQQRTTKTNKPYLNLILGDKTGQLEGRVWEPGDPRIAKDFDTRRHREGPRQRLPLRRPPADEGRPVAQGPAGRGGQDRPAAFDHLRRRRALEAATRLRRELHQPRPEAAAERDARRSGLAQAYREAPAAKQLHHAWLGGLLEHVVSLLTLADRVAPHYPLLDRDLLLTGVILHDIGKVRELSWEIGFEYTVEGILLGHIQMGAALAEKAMDSLPDFPPRLKTLVLHMILSHHGKLEFGSPKLPMIPEALVLNFLDDLDAKMQAMQGEFDKCAPRRQGAGRTDRQGVGAGSPAVAEYQAVAGRGRGIAPPIPDARVVN